ncbi:SRPBCC family protein [Nocardia lijiangensis]|uniref:SRPBCC family protein n=1 Tax=Nocardia lijiangensis TaxID=299618 RepID=UPI000831C8F3|nr:SRPBCC family protein [Nocardia lijiangensis]
MVTINDAQRYLKQGRVDPAARIRARVETTVEADADTLFQVLADLPKWPEVRRSITKMSVDGPIAAGTSFRWTSSGALLSSTLAVVTPGREVSWSGKFLWFTAIHRNTIVPLTAGRSTLVSEESMTGIGIGLIYSSSKLEKELRGWVDEFAAFAQQLQR